MRPEEPPAGAKKNSSAFSGCTSTSSRGVLRGILVTTASAEPNANLAQGLAKEILERMGATASAGPGPAADEPILGA